MKNNTFLYKQMGMGNSASSQDGTTKDEFMLLLEKTTKPDKYLKQ